MSYFDGFVAAVPAANKDAYLKQAADVAPLFREFGAIRMVEAWGEDVPDGKVTDFKGAVKAEPDEVVVFSWLEYPDKATRDSANAKVMSDPRVKEIGANMPFDAKRMIHGGFEAIVDDRAGGAMGYTDGYLIACPKNNRDAYIDVATKASAIFKEHGAIRVVEAWGDDVPDGKVTDYRMAVKARDDENVLFSWVEWPSKHAREQGWQKIMADDRMKNAMNPMPFDGQRMIYGGFEPILDVKG
jgi:uncharacterized protein YbaA (DUF1428 family)